MNSIHLTIIQTTAVLALSPLSIGLVRLFKARLQGRRGANPFLAYLSLATMLKKQMVISNGVSWVFRLVPFVTLSSSLFLVLVLPLVALGGSLEAYGDIFVVAGVLMLGAVFLVLGGLDAATAFGGMGSSREMTIASLLEPTVIMAFATLSLATASSTVGGMIGAGASLSHAPYLILTLIAFVLIALAENARYPVDNPATHLELTMVHEAMVLEYSGPYLAMLEFASAIKLTAFSLLIANLLFPAALLVQSGGIAAVALALGASVLKLAAVMGLLALLESSIAKMRFYRMQEYLTSAFFLALSGLVLALIQRAI